MSEEATPEPIELSVEISGKPGREAVYVGGHMIPCNDAHLAMDAATGLVSLTLTLPVVDGMRVALEDVRIFLDERTREALANLGWISPERLHEAMCQGEISTNTARALKGLEPWSFPEAVFTFPPELTPEQVADFERRFAEAVASDTTPKWIPSADGFGPGPIRATTLKEFHAAKLEAAGTDRLVEWDSSTADERLMRYGKCGCGTPLAARTVTARDDVLGVTVDYQAACPACARDEPEADR